MKPASFVYFPGVPAYAKRNKLKENDKISYFEIYRLTKFFNRMIKLDFELTASRSRSSDVELGGIDKVERSSICGHSDHEFFFGCSLFDPFTSGEVLENYANL